MPKEKKAAPFAPKYYPGDDLPAKKEKQTNGACSLLAFTLSSGVSLVNLCRLLFFITAYEVASFNYPRYHLDFTHWPFQREAGYLPEAASIWSSPRYWYVKRKRLLPIAELVGVRYWT